MYKTETIAAISTSMNNSGIGIVRISGEDALCIADKIFKSNKENKKLADAKSHTIHYGNIVDGEETIDEVLMMVMKAPNTYTREDVVEIDCHGGILIMKKILELIIKNGARCAEPGEFTKRAFLNGRIDLSQAEAVINLINAKSDMALDLSVNQLKGAVSEKIKNIRKDLLHEIAYIEAALDDPEHYEMDNYGAEIKPEIEDIECKLQKLLDTADDGRIITEGINTVILGKPNVGKSSLLNRLMGEERAIVTDIAGTTRDSLEENVKIQGMSLNIIDTAGIRNTDDVVEKIGVEKAKSLAAKADLVLMLIDSSTELEENDKEIIDIIKDKKAVILLNKSDLSPVISRSDIEKITDKDIFEISVKEDIGIDKVIEFIENMFYKGDINYNSEVYITNERHKSAIREAVESLKCVETSIENGMPEDFLTIDMMSAYESLGLIIGENVGDDLVNEIFSKFCMGK